MYVNLLSGKYFLEEPEALEPPLRCVDELIL